MDELHPLFRNDVPSTDELKSNDVYSALIEISAQKAQDKSMQGRKPPQPSKVSTNSKGIDKTSRSGKHIKGRYQRHLSMIRATRSKIEKEKSQEMINNNMEGNSNTKESSSNEQQHQERKELAEMEICMSIWSNKDTLSG